MINCKGNKQDPISQYTCTASKTESSKSFLYGAKTLKIARKSAVAVSALLLLVTQAVAIELTEYRDPNTEFDEAFIDFSANATDGNQGQASYDVLLNGFYNKRQSTEARVLNFRVDGNYDAARGPNDGDSTVDDYGFGLGIGADTYFNAVDEWFWFGSGSFEHQQSAVDDNLGITVGIGYGRVWNATPLAKALRVQAALNSNGLLGSELDDDTLRALADIIGREDEYRARDGQANYRGSWYTDMESAMGNSGALPGGELDALGTVKLDEVLFDEPVSARRHGWLVRAGAGVQSSDFSGLTDNDPKLLLEFEYAKPFGLTGQLIETASYEPVFGDNTVHRLRNRLSYSYEISDRIDWLNAWDLNYQQADDQADTRFVTNTLSSSFLYNLTNKLDLGLTLAAVDVDDDPNINTSNDEVSTSAVLGVRYRVK